MQENNLKDRKTFYFLPLNTNPYTCIHTYFPNIITWKKMNNLRACLSGKVEKENIRSEVFSA